MSLPLIAYERGMGDFDPPAPPDMEEEPAPTGVSPAVLRAYARFLAGRAADLARDAALNHSRCVGAGQYAVEIVHCHRLRGAWLAKIRFFGFENDYRIFPFQMKMYVCKICQHEYVNSPARIKYVPEFFTLR